MMGRRPTREELEAETARLVERMERAARDEAYWGNGPPPRRHKGLLGVFLR